MFMYVVEEWTVPVCIGYPHATQWGNLSLVCE